MLNVADRRGSMYCVFIFFSQKRSHAPAHTLWDIIQGVIRHKIVPKCSMIYTIFNKFNSITIICPYQFLAF